MNRLILLAVLLSPLPVQAEPHTIIHILNTHYVTRADFGAELRSNSIQNLTDDQIDDQYRKLLDDLELNQKAQKLMLRELIKKHRLKGIFIEGLTEKNYQGTLKFLEVLKQYEQNKTVPETEFDKLVAEQNRLDLLELGAAGQLVISGELQTILPADDSKALEAANPFRPDGSIIFTEKQDRERENAIVRNLMKADGVAVIVLGRDHDLRDNLKQLGKSSRYMRTDKHPPGITKGKIFHRK